MSPPARRFEGLDRGSRGLRWALASVALLVILTGVLPDALAVVATWLRDESDRLPWYVTRASALLAYLALSGSVSYGLLLSTGVTDRVLHRAVSVTLHRDLAGIGLALALVHAAVLVLDRSVPYDPVEVLVPLVGPYRPLWVAFGQLALAAAIVVTVSTYLRGRIGRSAWQRLHRVAFVAWAAATVHGIMSGSDASDPVVASMYIGVAAIVVGLTATRVTTAVAFGKGR